MANGYLQREFEIYMKAVYGDVPEEVRNQLLNAFFAGAMTACVATEDMAPEIGLYVDTMKRSRLIHGESPNA